ncbi:MAG: glycosyltransferase family 2 protein [Fuerstiella sp.]|nr:glycosyltransferase family 2 protein [Fuerstiella sp.]MCP4858872.1 glycosyltransferase family 2 protein [Fuerstiella sp.]
MSTPTVSVITTCYNRERYVAAAIESILDSTFSDFELLVVDDCSTDATVSIVEGYVRQDSRVRLHVNERNLGDYPNRNHAASLATGEFLKYVDADDYIYPLGLEIMVNTMAQFPDAGYGLCSLDQDRERPFPFSLSSRDAYLRHYFGASLFHKAPLSSIIRRSAWQHVGGFPEERMVGDYAMWHSLSCHFDVVLMSHGPVWYREHEQQEVSDILRDPIYYRIAYERVVQQTLSSPDCPLKDDEIQMAMQRYVWATRRTLVKTVCRLSFHDAWRLKQHMKGFRIA